MRTTEHNTKTSFAETGIFALLFAFFSVIGIDASKISQGGSGLLSARSVKGSYRRNERPSSALLRSSLDKGRMTAPFLSVAIFVILIASALFIPASAPAAFTRPFIGQVTGRCPFPGTCETNEAIPFAGPLGLAVDATDNLWVADGRKPPFQLDRFEFPKHEETFIESLEINGLEPPEPQGLTSPENLAIDNSNSTYHFYTSATNTVNGYGGYVEVFASDGKYIKRFGPFQSPYMTVDGSTGASAGTVYVTTGGSGARTLSKFNAKGEPENFTDSAPYISGNQITGDEEEPVLKGQQGEFGALAVDAQGDIFVTSSEAIRRTEPAVLEYRPSGELFRVFTGHETPGFEASTDNGGFGGTPSALAVDPITGDLLVSLTGARGNGAIDEFDSAGHYLNQITATSPGHPLHDGTTSVHPLTMAVDSHGDLYVIEDGGNQASEHAVDAFGPGALLPDLRLGEPTQRSSTAAILNGTVDPEGLSLTECAFQYVTEAAFNADGFADLPSGGEKPCVPASIPQDKEFHSVHAEITGLTSGVTYRYRLIATTGSVLGGLAESTSAAFTAPHAPGVGSVAVENISSTFADLHATIDPLGTATTYRFEYLTQAEYRANGESFSGSDPAVAVPAPDAAIGAGGPTGSSPEAVLQHLGGLKAATAYRFRVVATNECEAVEHPGKECVTEGETAFATLPEVSLGLPDNRAYELLTPPDKGGAADMFDEPIMNGEYLNRDEGLSSESGDQFLLGRTFAAFGSFPAASANAYTFSRTSTGWVYTSLAVPSLGVQSINQTIFDPADFSRVAIEAAVGSSASEAGERPTAMLGTPGGPYTALHVDSPLRPSVEEQHVVEDTHVVGGSRDLSHVVLESFNHALAPGAGEQDENSPALYESTGAGECGPTTSNCTLLSLNPKNKVFRCGAVLGRDAEITSGVGDASGINFGGSHNAVSPDGSSVFFTAPDPALPFNSSAPAATEGCWNPSTGENAPQLYMRSAGSTIEISGPEAGLQAEKGHHLAIYVGASADHSRVFFLSEGGELTRDDEGIHDIELYEYDVGTAKLTRVSRGVSGKAAAAVWNVPEVSADGSTVYFTAFGQLAAGAPATSGEEVNLYHYDTAMATIAYVATVNIHDYPYGFGHALALATTGNWDTTPDGRYLLFSSSRELTGYATASSSHGCAELPNSGGDGNGHCEELYRYDSAANGGAGEITCVSCNPSGAPPVSNAEIARSALEVADAGSVRAISDDGAYVFFDTADALVPSDTNHTLDVYEWEAGGTGSCRGEQGCISLISSGHDSAPSFFLGVSPDGSNVFFGTHARLVPQDTDSEGDIYDARICTAENPCIKQPPDETAQCEGGACQTPPPTPIDATPGSLTFSGTGDLVSELTPPPAPKTTTKHATMCAKGKKLRHGKCVKPKKKAKKAKRARRATSDRRAKR